MFENLDLSQFVLLAGLTYTLIEFLKPVYDAEKHKWNFDRVGALAVGIGLCFAAKFDLFAEANIDLAVPYVGNALSGILIGGSVGAGLFHDFPSWLKSLFSHKL